MPISILMNTAMFFHLPHWQWKWNVGFSYTQPWKVCDITRLGVDQLFVGLTTFVSVCSELCVTSQDWDSINYLRDWPLFLAFVKWGKSQEQPPALGKVERLQLAISWPKIGFRKHLKLLNYSNNYELSKNAIKKAFSLLSHQKGIVEGVPKKPVELLLPQSYRKSSLKIL